MIGPYLGVHSDWRTGHIVLGADHSLSTAIPWFLLSECWRWSLHPAMAINPQ